MKKLILALVLVGVSSACNGTETGETEPEECGSEITVQWGHEGPDGFVAFADGDDAEITRGFQGFRYVTSTVRLQGTEADSAVLSFRIDVEGHDAYSQNAGEDLSADSDGARYADEVLVFFNDIPLQQLVGRGAEISLHATVGACEADHGAMVTLVDEVDCIELENGELECTST